MCIFVKLRELLHAIFWPFSCSFHCLILCTKCASQQYHTSSLATHLYNTLLCIYPKSRMKQYHVFFSTLTFTWLDLFILFCLFSFLFFQPSSQPENNPSFCNSPSHCLWRTERFIPTQRTCSICAHMEITIPQRYLHSIEVDQGRSRHSVVSNSWPRVALGAILSWHTTREFLPVRHGVLIFFLNSSVKILSGNAVNRCGEIKYLGYSSRYLYTSPGLRNNNTCIGMSEWVQTKSEYCEDIKVVHRTYNERLTWSASV